MARTVRRGRLVPAGALVVVLLAVWAVPLTTPAVGAAPGPTTIAFGADDTPVNPSAATPDGHWVLLDSPAKDLGGPTSGHANAYVWNRDTRQITALTDGNQDVHPTAISDDGRYVTVQSTASNLVPGVAGLHVFQIDRVAHTTVALAPDSQDSFSPDTSPDGRFVVFVHGDDVNEVAIWDRLAGRSQDLVDGWNPKVSDDGRFIAFTRAQGDQQIFLYDRSSGTTTQVTNGNGRSIIHALSADGRTIAFSSRATDLVPGGTTGEEVLFLYDQVSGSTTAVTDGGYVLRAYLSDDGRHLAYDRAPSLQRTNESQVYELDRTSGSTTQVTAGNGGSGLSGMSRDGRFTLIASEATNLVEPVTSGTQAFLHDGATGTTVALTRGNHPSYPWAITTDGRGIFVSTTATDLGNPPSAAKFRELLVDLGPTSAQNRSFVEAAFNDFLGRDPTPAELTTDVVALDSGDRTRSVIVRDLSRSPEWVEAIVRKLYVDTLGRTGDPGGVAYWAGEIRSGRRTVANVAANLYASPEYYDGLGGGTAGTWVADLYQKLLGRAADPGGKAYWVGQTTAIGRYGVAIRFYQSAESARARVRHLYQGLLGREPDAGGSTYWAAQVVVVGDLALAVSLASGEEYFRQAQARFP